MIHHCVQFNVMPPHITTQKDDFEDFEDFEVAPFALLLTGF
jgi:hypothetical protein